MANTTAKRRPFTLIELLVVVAIVALLAALLLPVLSRAKALSLRAVCQSNLKQIYTGAAMYADDFAGALPTAPTAGAPWGWGNARSGTQWCMPNYNFQPTWNPSGWWSLLSGEHVPLAVVECPAMDVQSGFDFTNGKDVPLRQSHLSHAWGGTINYGYRYNHKLDMNWYYSKRAPYKPKVLFEGDRSWRPLFTDASEYRVDSGTHLPKTRTVFNWNFNTYRWAHQEGGNYAAHDGRVVWRQNYINHSNLGDSWPTPSHIQTFAGAPGRGLDEHVDH